MKKIEFELNPIHDTRNSFYKKSVVFRVENDDGVDYGIRIYAHYYNATSPETTRFFKNFQGYRQRLKQDTHGRYMFTKSIHGFSNYYYYYI